MSYQTLVISCRNIKNESNKGNTLFGDKPGPENTFRIATAQAMPLWAKKKVKHPGGKGYRYQKGYNKKPYSLTLVDKNQEQSTLEHIVQNPNGKPWLFFLHGNNQTFKKNMMKSRRIQEKYDVNMVVFSWPSRSYDDKLNMFIFGALLLAVIKKGGSVLALKKGLERKIKQYREASKMAETSVGSFLSSFQFLRDHLFTPIKNHSPDTNCNMLVHSLGHKILRLAVESQELNGFEFDNMLLHHADTKVEGHRDWLTQLQIAAPANTHIAVNQQDATLFLSDMQQNILPESGKVSLKAAKQLASYFNYFRKQAYLDNIHRTRLGNHLDDGQSPVPIIDVTGREEIGKTHSSAWDEDITDELFAEYKAIIG